MYFFSRCAILLVSISVASLTKLESTNWMRSPHITERVQSAKWTLSSVSVTACAKECGQRADDCPAFSYDKGQGLCYLGPTLTAGVSDEVHYVRDDVNMTSSSSSNAASGLPSGYTMLSSGNSGVQVETRNKISWQAAQTSCQEDGGHLFRMQTLAKKDELAQIKQELGLPDREYWVDATDIASDGNYVWGDGDPVDGSLWLSRSPANMDCVKATWDLQLQDANCVDHLLYICEVTPA